MSSLMRRGRALVVRDRKLVLDTPACRMACCGDTGCPVWRLLIQCVFPDCDGNIPPPTRLWYCDGTLTCSNGGAPIRGGVVVFEGHCYTVTEVTSPDPQDGQRIPPSIVECYWAPEIDNCRNNNCPQGPLWYPAYICADLFLPNPQIVWVCGARPGCRVHSPGGLEQPWCLVVHGTNGVPFHRIPTDPVPLAFINASVLGPTRPSCCGCTPGGIGTCSEEQLLDYDPAGFPACVGGNPGVCCCSRDFGTIPFTTMQVTRWRTEQTATDPRGPVFNGTITIEMIGRCATAFIRACIDGYGNPPGSPSCADFGQVNCFRRCPGNWPAQAPRLTTGSFGNTLLTPAWGEYCENTSGGDESLITQTFASTRECNAFSQVAQYLYTLDLGTGTRRVTTRFEYTARITGPNPCAGACPSAINRGRPIIVPGGGGIDLPGGPLILPSSGCIGCGEGQARSPA